MVRRVNAADWPGRRRYRWWRCAAVAVVLAVVPFASAQPPRHLLTPPLPKPTADGAAIATDFENDHRTLAPDNYYLTDDPGYFGPNEESSGVDLPYAVPPYVAHPSDHPPPTYSPWLPRLGLRHSYTHGRNVGWGAPLVGTSWLNRPYYVGGAVGTLWMTRSVEDSVSRDTDTFGRIYVGWDWDYYWSTELELARATPELVNSAAPDAPRGDRLMHWSYNLLYYPWGDSKLRPYWRLGIGRTAFDYPTDRGRRYDASLATIPIGVGVKYPLRHWLAARAEFTDYWSIAHAGVDTQHNLALTFGLECHFGARPKSYWPWNPSRHIW